VGQLFSGPNTWQLIQIDGTGNKSKKKGREGGRKFGDRAAKLHTGAIAPQPRGSVRRSHAGNPAGLKNEKTRKKKKGRYLLEEIWRKRTTAGEGTNVERWKNRGVVIPGTMKPAWEEIT